MEASTAHNSASHPNAPHLSAVKAAHNEERASRTRAEEVRAHIAEGKMLDDAPAPEQETPAPDAAAEPTEIFHSPVSRLARRSVACRTFAGRRLTWSNVVKHLTGRRCLTSRAVLTGRVRRWGT